MRQKSSQPPFAFTHFQTEVLPKWQAQFRSGEKMGEYRLNLRGPTSLYGTADLVFIHAITDTLKNLTDREKSEWAAVINQFQDPGTGHYHETLTHHHQAHKTAYAVAALTLLGRKPQFPMLWKTPILASETAMLSWIETVDWADIWPSSHIIAGVPSALTLTGEGTPAFYEWYFRFLDSTVDTTCGFWRRKQTSTSKAPINRDLGGAFHLFFMYEWFHRPWLHPTKVVDAVLKLQKRSGFWGGSATSFIDLDALFSLIRSSRNANWYRKDEVYHATIRYLFSAATILNNHKKVMLFYRGTHGFVGAVAAIAECQKFFPELVESSQPWIQTLDKACFI